jgi:hypothetical protein
MKENVRQGFWSGARPPLGYTTVEVERRGARVKKKLAIDPVEAEQVRLMFKLYLEGDEGSGPMGIKGIASWLNEHGYPTRTGAQWGIGRVHALLRNPVYAGRQRFNVKDSRTFRLKPASEHVYCDAPAIVSNEVFEEAQAKLRLHHPTVTPPRVVNGATLRTGLAVCATCGAGMTLRTGTSRTGAVLRYYSRSNFLKKGRTACRGRNMRTERLDKLVIEGLEGDLLEPGRLSAMLSQLDGMLAERAAAVSRRLAAPAREAEDADDRLRRLYKLVEDGRAELDDLLADRIADLKRARERAHAVLERARSATRATQRSRQSDRNRALHAGHARAAQGRHDPVSQGLPWLAHRPHRG